MRWFHGILQKRERLSGYKKPSWKLENQIFHNFDAKLRNFDQFCLKEEALNFYNQKPAYIGKGRFLIESKVSKFQALISPPSHD